jgi:hypothetical protein
MPPVIGDAPSDRRAKIKACSHLPGSCERLMVQHPRALSVPVILFSSVLRDIILRQHSSLMKTLGPPQPEANLVNGLNELATTSGFQGSTLAF